MGSQPLLKARRANGRFQPAAEINHNGARMERKFSILSADRKLTAVQVNGGATFASGQPVPLFQTRVPPSNFNATWNNYVVAADGQRFLINNVVQDTAAPITVVLNWTAGLKK